MEYDLNNPATWVVHQEPPRDSAFDDELLRIGGRNPHGDPNLVRRWGGTYRNKGVLVYKLCDTEPTLVGHEFRDPVSGAMREVELGEIDQIPQNAISVPLYRSVELGELRWIIEYWVSPEQLASMGYFDSALRYQTEETDFSRDAFHEFRAMVEAGDDPEKAMMRVENQVDRARSLKVDEQIKTYFDPAWRTNGDYLFFLRLERKDGTYHPPDSEALEAIAAVWEYNTTTTPAQRAADEEEQKAQAAKERQRRIDELWSPEALRERGLVAA